MHPAIKDMPEMRVATMPHTGPYNEISEAFGRLSAIAGGAGLFRPESMLIGLYYDDPDTKPAAELRSAAALVVSPGITLPAELGDERIAAGRYACTTHLGSYRELSDVWGEFIDHWLPASGHRIDPDRVTFELYRNNPHEVPEAELRTELYIPLA